MVSPSDGDWPVAPDPDDVPAGKALVAFKQACVKVRFGRRVAELTFTIVEPVAFTGRVVRLFASLPDEGSISTASKYYLVWCLANGQPPGRRDRMSPLVFRGYWWVELVRTRRTTIREGIRDLSPDEPGRTVIGHLIERAAGAPGLPIKRRNRVPAEGSMGPEDEVRRAEVKDENR